jgi:hypothetical protein
MAIVKSDTSLSPGSSPDGSSLSPVRTLDELIARHPAELRARYLAGTPVALSQLKAHTWRGEMLAFEWMKHGYAIARPMFKLASWIFFWPWTGMRFEDEVGTNIWLGASFLRFKNGTGPSLLDDEPTFQFLYDEVKQAWPTKNMVDEVRLVGDDLVVGATFRNKSPTIWFGLEPKR